MNIFLVISAGILIVSGLVGTVWKKFPATILSYLGIILLHYSTLAQYSVHFFISWGLLIIAIQGLDYILPNWGNRRFGGSKKGVWGGFFGLIVGLVFGKWGMVAGAVTGAFIGELIAGKKSNEAIHESVGAFVIFILGTISQLIVSGVFLHHYIDSVCYLL